MKQGYLCFVLCLSTFFLTAQHSPAFQVLFEGLAQQSPQTQNSLLEERLTHWLAQQQDSPTALAVKSDALLKKLESKGYFKAASFLSKQLQQEERCSFTPQLKRKITHYTMVEEGTTAPQFSLDHPEALKLNFPKEGIANGKTLLFFWSSGCPHCQRELPKVAALQKQLNQQNIALLSISLDREETVFRTTAQRYDWAHYSDFQGWGSPVAQAFKVFATPSFFLLEKGILHKEFLSAAQLADYIEN